MEPSLINYFTPVTNTSQIVYDAMRSFIDRYQDVLQSRPIVIYGAGTRGSLLSLLLEQHGIREFFFTDQNSNLYGHAVNTHVILNIEEIYRRSENWFIIVTPENSEEIIHRLETSGFQKHTDFINLGGLVTGWLVGEYQKKQEKEVILLGDCGFLYCSLQDTVKKDLGCILSEEIEKEGRHTKRLTMNAITVRGLYTLLAAQLELGRRPSCVLASLDVSNFNGKQQFLPNMQHVDLFQKLYDETPLDCLKEYLTTARERYRRFSKNAFVPKKSSTTQDPQELANKSYVRTNYMYRFNNKNNENEEIQYLLKIAGLMKKNNIPILFFFLPINYQKCQAYWGETFHQRFAENKTAITEILRRQEIPVYDYSFLLDETYFKDSGTFDEAASYEGRKQVGKRMMEQFTNDVLSNHTGRKPHD